MKKKTIFITCCSFQNKCFVYCYLLGSDYVLSTLSLFLFLPPRSKILDLFLRIRLSLSFFISLPLPLSFLFFPPRTESDRVAREPMQPPPTEQTGVPAWNARPHTDAATPTRVGGSVSSLPFGDSPLRALASLRRARPQPRERIDDDALYTHELRSRDERIRTLYLFTCKYRRILL